MTNLAKWLSKIEAGHPTDIDMGLTRVASVAQRLGIDFSNSAVLSVAGTNGKGTTCRLIEQCCLEAGLSVGVYSSPHILLFNERFRINQFDVNDDDICAAFATIERAKAEISLSYFEYATLAAMLLFQEANLDVVILEVGLGGRLDATNIIDADVNVVTSIALDHQDYLGHTLNEIAREKVGIVKAHKRTVIGYDARYGLAEDWLAQQNNDVLRLGVDFNYSSSAGGYQGELSISDRRASYRWQASAIPSMNVMTAIASLYFLVEVLSESSAQALNDFLLATQKVEQTIEGASLAGRAQVIHNKPCVLIDVAHNAASAEHLMSVIGTFEFTHCHIVVGMLKDKNIEQTLQSLSEISAHWYCASLHTARGEEFTRLVKAVPDKNALSVNGFDNIAEALASAVKQAANTDMIVVVGSFVTVAQAMSFFKAHPLD